MKDSHAGISRQYELRFGNMADYRDAVWKILCPAFFSKYIAAEATVLDLGAGWGEFINNIAAAHKYAMDINPATGGHLAPQVVHLHQSCTAPWPLDSASLDVVFTSNFLEHLPGKDAIEQTMDEAYRCLKPGGLFMCLGPNIRYVRGAYWDFWDHCVPLTDRSCAEVLRLHGFDILQQTPRFLPYSMSAGSNPPLFLVRLYLHLPWLWPLLGKQFFVIGKKPQR